MGVNRNWARKHDENKNTSQKKRQKSIRNNGGVMAHKPNNDLHAWNKE